ncbi:MAG TPA: Flp pilus assembly protein CpaB [Bryobacteraceae bacterium]|jgi:pilus assembly protein CpaB
MNRRLLIIVVIALIIATGASYLVYRMAQTRMIANGTPLSNRIVVAAKNLQIGAVVHDTDLTFATWTGPLPKGFIVSGKEIVDRGVVSPIYEGEPVTENRLAPTGAGGGFAVTIPNGMRACAVRVNEVVGVAGFVVPGMRVDVLISGNSPATPGAGPRVKTLLQNVEVLSAGQNYQKDAEGKPVEVPVVNLLVTPEQAEVLSLASNETRIQLVLRNPMDNETAKTSGSAMSDLFGDQRPKPAAPPTIKVAIHQPAPPPTPVAQPAPVLQTQRVEVLNGSRKTETSFTKTEENR